MFLDEGVVVKAGARIGPYTVLGRQCHVEEDAVVRGSILWANTRVGREAHRRGCRFSAATATWAGQPTVGAGAVLGDKSVLTDCEVEAGRGSRVTSVVQCTVRRWEPAKCVDRSRVPDARCVRRVKARCITSGARCVAAAILGSTLHQACWNEASGIKRRTQASGILELSPAARRSRLVKVNPAIFKAYDVRGLYPGEINEEVGRRDRPRRS